MQLILAHLISLQLTGIIKSFIVHFLGAAMGDDSSIMPISIGLSALNIDSSAKLSTM